MSQGVKQKSMIMGGAVAASQILFVALIWSQADADGPVSFMLGLMIILALAGVALQLGVLRRAITEPIQALQGALRQSQNGQSPTWPTEGSSEVQDLVRVLQQTFDQGQKNNQMAAGTKAEVIQSAKSLLDGSNRMSRQLRDLHEVAEQVATAMDEMTATAREVSENAGRAAEQTQTMNASVHTGQKSMDDANKSIHRLATQMDMAVETVRRLEEDSSNVGKVLSVIRGIAEQTNLLALNAAIEAARAGEQGRGFAVVADEVRSLAQKTQESTQEIQIIIENVQNGAKNATSVIDSSKSITTETSSFFSAAGTQLEEISDAVGTLSDLNSQVARAVDEQTKATDSISREISRVSQIADEFQEIQQGVSGLASQIANG